MGNTVDNIMDSCSEIPEFTIIKGPMRPSSYWTPKDGAERSFCHPCSRA